jgi:hypothetical protein
VGGHFVDALENFFYCPRLVREVDASTVIGWGCGCAIGPIGSICIGIALMAESEDEVQALRTVSEHRPEKNTAILR